MFQFEYTSQHLVFANCIPLVLKFFNQNINSYVTAKNKTCKDIGMNSFQHTLPADTSEEDLLKLVDDLNNDDQVNVRLVDRLFQFFHLLAAVTHRREDAAGAGVFGIRILN